LYIFYFEKANFNRLLLKVSCFWQIWAGKILKKKEKKKIGAKYVLPLRWEWCRISALKFEN
jgi:hypothetical protein